MGYFENDYENNKLSQIFINILFDFLDISSSKFEIKFNVNQKEKTYLPKCSYIK